MRVRLLGPVDVVVDGTAREVSGLRRKAVLAVLGLHPGQRMGVEALIDLVWGSDPPATAVNTLQSHVSYLRRVVGDRHAIVTQGAAYVLNTGAEPTDVQAAERLIQEGRRTADAALLRTALELWRGPALSDVTGVPWLEAEAHRLSATRLDAVLALAEVRLSDGEHDDLIPELDRLTREHRWHEQVYRLLMLAQYRAGHQADALATYRRLRRALDADLGIAPSRELRDLEVAILRQNRELDPPARRVTVAAPRSTGRVPAQLPPAVAAFAGREADLARLDRLLPQADGADGGFGPAARIAAVSGAAGIGKTTLVVRWAHGVADRFPDGQLFVNLRGYHPSGEHLSPADALRSFLEAFGIATNRIPADLDSRAALYRSVLNGRRVLVVLDNARDVEQVRPLLPGYPGCVVVVTSRDRMVELVTAEAADTVLVGPLGAGEARDLLARRLGDDRLAAEPEAIADIVSRCAGLPLALAVTAATCAIRPGFALAAAAAWLSDPTAVLAAPSGAPGRADVRAVFSWSYRTLDEPSARMFRLIGLNSGPDLTTPAAASLAGLSEVAARPLLGQLVEAGLLLVDNAGRYACHDLVHAYAADLATRLDPAGERTEAMWRLIDHYLHSAFVAARLFNPQREPISLDQPRPGVTAERRADLEEASAWFDVERPALLAALRTAVRLGSDRHTWQLAWVVQDHLARGGHWDDQVANQLAAIEATRRAGLPLAEAHALCTLASAYARLQRYDEAEADLHRALALHAAANDHAGHANAHYQLGWLSNRRGRHGAALGHARQALRLFRLAGSPLGTARALNSLGWDHALHGDFARAQPRCERALAELRRLGDRHFEAAAADSLGFIHHRLGDYPAAVGHYRHALELFRESGDRYHTADTLNHLGDVHLADADAEAAATAWQAALAIFEELDYSDAEGVRAKLADLEPPAT